MTSWKAAMGERGPPFSYSRGPNSIALGTRWRNLVLLMLDVLDAAWLTAQVG